MKVILKTMFIAVLFSLFAGPFSVLAAEFPDLPGDHWARREILEMQTLNVIAGAKDGNFYPEAPVTRAQFATIITKSLKLPIQTSGKSRFTDVQKGYWATGYIEAAASAGFINGYQGKFRPADNISRQEMAVIIMKISGKYGYAADGSTDVLIKYKDGNDVAPWAASAFNGSLRFAYMNGVNEIETVTNSVYKTPWFKRELKPGANATRAEAAYALYKLLVKTGLV
ncbi:MAG TPA: S-layer homology domain-containing protein [Desulfobacteria bacterium]|nr:S-layer homology domain-containing protein [Desulfobacteria bacterium]